MAEQEAEQLQRESAAAVDTDGEPTTLLNCPRKERGKQEGRVQLRSTQEK